MRCLVVLVAGVRSAAIPSSMLDADTAARGDSARPGLGGDANAADCCELHVTPEGVRDAAIEAASATGRGSMVVGDDAADISAAGGPRTSDGDALEARPALSATSSVWLPPDNRTARSGELLEGTC